MKQTDPEKWATSVCDKKELKLPGNTLDTLHQSKKGGEGEYVNAR